MAYGKYELRIRECTKINLQVNLKYNIVVFEDLKLNWMSVILYLIYNKYGNIVSNICVEACLINQVTT